MSDALLIHTEGLTAAVRTRGSRGPAWSSPPIELELRSGELVAVTGPTRSGKSTVVHLLAGWLAATAGEIDWPAAPSTPPPWSHLTVVPQPLALLDELTVIENIEFAQRAASKSIAPVPTASAPMRGPTLDVDGLLQRLDLGHLRDRGIEQISIGERQRVMVARALAGPAPIVLADEPVAHQDERRAEAVLDLLAEAVDGGAACVIATREPAIAARAHRVITLG